MTAPSPWELAARSFERRLQPSVDLDLVNLIRGAKGLPEWSEAEAVEAVVEAIRVGAVDRAVAQTELCNRRRQRIPVV